MVTTRGARANAKECSSCWETKPLNDFPPTRPTTQCDHEIKTCTECMHNWIATKLDNTYQLNSSIQCPDCEVDFVGKHIYNNAPREIHARYWHRSQLIVQSLQPGARWCLNPACNNSQILSPADFEANDWGCTVCYAEACVTCERPYHGGETCEEFAERNIRSLVEEKVTARTVASLKETGAIRSCPNCSCPMMKDDDPLEQIRCPRCQYRFDWKAA